MVLLARCLIEQWLEICWWISWIPHASPIIFLFEYLHKLPIRFSLFTKETHDVCFPTHIPLQNCKQPLEVCIFLINTPSFGAIYKGTSFHGFLFLVIWLSLKDDFVIICLFLFFCDSKHLPWWIFAHIQMNIHSTFLNWENNKIFECSFTTAVKIHIF